VLYFLTNIIKKCCIFSIRLSPGSESAPGETIIVNEIL
jgi:hypothetical protein